MNARLVKYLMQLWKQHRQHLAIRMRHLSIGLVSWASFVCESMYSRTIRGMAARA